MREEISSANTIAGSSRKNTFSCQCTRANDEIQNNKGTRSKSPECGKVHSEDCGIPPSSADGGWTAYPNRKLAVYVYEEQKARTNFK